MSSNIYNIRLNTGMELITEMLSFDDINEIDESVAELFTDGDKEDTVLLSHPIVVLTIPVTHDGEVMIDSFYHPYLQHGKHACVAIDSSLIMAIDEMHPDAVPDYIEAVIAVYGHLYDNSDEPEEQDTPTVH